jgi:2-hydroxychromene-2-carboxylate isomerase
MDGGAGPVYRPVMIPPAPAFVDLWFDFSSPYSYIANEWVDALAASHGRTVRRAGGPF